MKIAKEYEATIDTLTLLTCRLKRIRTQFRTLTQNQTIGKRESCSHSSLLGLAFFKSLSFPKVWGPLPCLSTVVIKCL